MCACVSVCARALHEFLWVSLIFLMCVQYFVFISCIFVVVLDASNMFMGHALKYNENYILLLLLILFTIY